MNKKAIAILGVIFLLIVGTLGFLIYSKYSGGDPTPVDNTGLNNTATTTDSNISDPETGSEDKVVKLTGDQVLSPVLFYNGEGITYFDQTGNLFQSSLLVGSRGTLELSAKKQLEIPTKSGITKIVWPRKGDNFIAEVASLGKKTYSFYNSQTGVYVDLNPQIGALDWLPEGDKIYYVWSNPDVTKRDTANVSDPDTQNWKNVGEMWEKNVVVSVSPDGASILFYKSNPSDSNSIGMTTPDGKVWKTLVKDGVNSGVLWSPDSRKFLFGKKNITSQNYQVWLYDFMTGEIKNLGLSATIDKVVWDTDSQTIYAAANDALGQESFYKFNTATLEKTEHDAGSAAVDAYDLFLNSDSDKLFFRNAADGGLYYLDLSK